MKDNNSKKSRTGLYIFLIVLVVVLAAGGAFLIYANSYVNKTLAKYDGKILDNVTIEDVSVEKQTKEEAAANIRNYIYKNANSKKITIICDDVKCPVKAAKFSVAYDVDGAVEKAYKVGRKGNFIKKFFRLREILKDKKGKNIKVGRELSEESAGKIVAKVAKKVNRKPENAKIRLGKKNKVKVIKEKNGIMIKTDDSIKTLVSYMGKEWDLKDGQVEIQAEIDKPELTSDDFKDMTDILGKYTTTYDYWYTGRRMNIENGTSKINGSFVKPGEVFSVYKTVAPFTAKNGYYLAGTYQGKEVVDDYGGGICQVATTLYNAAIRSELKIKERHCHGMTIHYVPLSFDAAISGSDEDLKFENNLKYPIYIKGYNDGGSVTFIIIGKETRPKNRKIEFTSKTLSVTPHGVKEIKDKTLPKGKKVVEREGSTGYSAELWKTIYVDKKKKKSYRFNSSYYMAVDSIVHIGTKKVKKKNKDAKKKPKVQ